MTYRRGIVVALTVLLAGTARGADERPAPVAPPGGESLKLDQYYGDAVSRIGSFPGKLVCVSTDRPFVPENATTCAPDKVYALALQGSNTTIPMIASSEAAKAQFGKLLDQTVLVRGKHYPDKDMIAAASVDPRPAADAPAAPADR
jgi:hypothetical protein